HDYKTGRSLPAQSELDQDWHGDLINRQLPVLIQLRLRGKTAPRLVVVYLKGPVGSEREPIDEALDLIVIPRHVYRESNSSFDGHRPFAVEGLLLAIIQPDAIAAYIFPIFPGIALIANPYRIGPF